MFMDGDSGDSLFSEEIQSILDGLLGDIDHLEAHHFDMFYSDEFQS